MIHKMKLNESPFERIKNGTKTIEFRLYDEKRRKIRIGDEIEFSKLSNSQEKIIVEVIDFYKDTTFENLFRGIYSNEEEIKRKTESMHQYYSYEQEKENGVIGIKIKLLKINFRYTYNKLVRDKIPENIDSDPRKKSKFKILENEAYLKELNKKILEEANEFIQENSIEELGDLLEVIEAIRKLKGYTIEEIKRVMKDKAKSKGVFNKKIFLEYVDEES